MIDMHFGPESTADEVLAGLDLTGRVAVVTGGTSGLGAETARALAAARAEVLVSARSQAKGSEAVRRLQAAVPSARVSFALLRLESFASVRKFAADVLARHNRIDFLINNAGIMATPFSLTEHGFEEQFATNHLGHFLLTRLLLPALRETQAARVISLASAGHHMAGIQWDDINFERRIYDKWKSYGQSKTANILFAIALDRRSPSTGMRAYSVNPGAIATGLSAHFSLQDREVLNAMLGEASVIMQMKTKAQGAASTVWAATAPQLAETGGAYIEDCRISQPGVPGSYVGQAPWARDPEAATRLWRLSETLLACGTH